MSKKEENFYKSGNKKFDEGDYQGAIDDYSKAIELDPENPEIYISRALCKKFSKDYKGAIDDSTKAIELDPENPARYITRAYSKSYLEDIKVQLMISQKQLN